MKKIFLTLIVLFTFLFMIGCDSTDNPITPDTPMAKPTNLTAYSKSSTEVGLAWVKSVDVNNSSFGSYVLKVKIGTQVISTITVPKTDSTGFVGGLTEGTIYTFVLASKTTGGTVGDSVTIQWAPAKRIDADNGGVAIKLYEWNSSLPSGLDLQNSSGQAEVVSMSGTKKTEVDVIFDYPLTGTNLEFVSPKTRASTLKTINFSTTTVNTNTLDDPRASFPDASTFANNIELIFTNQNTSTGLCVFAKTQEGNYVRILILSKSGSIVQGTTPNRFVEVKVSYQSVTNVPFAKTSK